MTTATPTQKDRWRTNTTTATRSVGLNATRGPNAGQRQANATRAADQMTVLPQRTATIVGTSAAIRARIGQVHHAGRQSHTCQPTMPSGTIHQSGSGRMAAGTNRYMAIGG